MASCIDAVSRGYFSVVFLLRRVMRFYERFKKEIVVIMPACKSLVVKAFRHGFYWLMAHGDAEDLVSKCDGC